MTPITEELPSDPAVPSEAVSPAVIKPEDEPPAPGPDAPRIRMVIVAGVVMVLLGVFALAWHAARKTNHEALAATAKPVSVVKAVSTTFRSSRVYVGTTNPWNMAKVGPQYVSAYVGSVLVRPGAAVKKGQVLATLDCRNASAASQAIASRAKALDERRIASEHEMARTKELTAGGFASANEIEQLTAKSAAEKAEGESMRASLVGKTLEVDDCILRAPFEGEIADRLGDPGAYLRPGNPLVTIIDRSTVRISADAPEADFEVVAPGTPVRMQIEASGKQLQGTVSRRAPAADDVTRTIHFEIDVPNGDHALPVGTTARITIDVGKPQPATTIPLRAATVRGDSATLFTVSENVAHHVTGSVLGEQSGTLYLAPALAAGTLVVVEGRAILDDKDRVVWKELP